MKYYVILGTILVWQSFGATVLAEPNRHPPIGFTYPHMPYINFEPGQEYADSQRMFQGIPSIAIAPGGRLWATWYGGGIGESQDNYVLLATSGDGGKNWSEPKLVVDPPFRASEPALWLDSKGSLWFMFNIYPIRTSVEDKIIFESRFDNIEAYQSFIDRYNYVGTQLWVMTTDNPDAESPKWSSPRLVAMETHNMNKPTVLSDGTWLLPAAPVFNVRGLLPRPLFSNDEGYSFTYRGGVPVPREARSANEYQVVERKDGVLWLLNRASYGIGESFSYDMGRTWSEMTPSKIAHTVSRFFITRLKSGNLLLVKHGEIEEQGIRENLKAFVSKDDGKTWVGGLMIDERYCVSYPDGVQSEDGRIYIIYDFNRHHDKEILMAVFTESDVLAGKPVSPEATFRQLVNKATGLNTRHR